MPRKNDNMIDISAAIGRRIQELRLSMGLSRKELSARIGVTHQQLHKYECGTNTFSIARLATIAEVLEKPITYFIEGLLEDKTYIPSEHRRMCIEVSRNFMSVKDVKHQEAINNMVRVLAE